MSLPYLIKHILSNPRDPHKNVDDEVQRIGNEYPYKLTEQGQIGALGHAYGTALVGEGFMNLKEDMDKYPSNYDRHNNSVADRFFRDLKKSNPPSFMGFGLTFPDKINKAKRSIFGMQDTKNPHPVPYNWDVKYNNDISPPPIPNFLKEEDPVNWYDNIHSFFSPQTSSGIIDYQPDNQQQNQQQSQQPIAPQIPNTPVSPNPHIDPPLVPDEIIIPVPDTKTDEMVRVWGPSSGGVPGSENITKHMANWILTNYPDSETSNRYQQSGWDTSKGTGPDSGWVPLYNYPILSYTNDMAQAYADANPD